MLIFRPQDDPVIRTIPLRDILGVAAESYKNIPNGFAVKTLERIFHVRDSIFIPAFSDIAPRPSFPESAHPYLTHAIAQRRRRRCPPVVAARPAVHARLAALMSRSSFAARRPRPLLLPPPRVFIRAAPPPAASARTPRAPITSSPSRLLQEPPSSSFPLEQSRPYHVGQREQLQCRPVPGRQERRPASRCSPFISA